MMRYFILGILLGRVLGAATLLSVSPSQETVEIGHSLNKKTAWMVGDRFCVNHVTHAALCGTITKVTSKIATGNMDSRLTPAPEVSHEGNFISLNFDAATLKTGQQVQVVKNKAFYTRRTLKTKAVAAKKDKRIDLRGHALAMKEIEVKEKWSDLKRAQKQVRSEQIDIILNGATLYRELEKNKVNSLRLMAWEQSLKSKHAAAKSAVNTATDVRSQKQLNVLARRLNEKEQHLKRIETQLSKQDDYIVYQLAHLTREELKLSQLAAQAKTDPNSQTHTTDNELLAREEALSKKERDMEQSLEDIANQKKEWDERLAKLSPVPEEKAPQEEPTNSDSDSDADRAVTSTPE